MIDYIEIHWSTGSIDEARRICRYLVQERIVACAQIVPWIESIYMWNNQLETTQETKVVLKTRYINFEKIKDCIIKNCTYDIPEITYTVIDGGNEKYLEWLMESSTELTSSQMIEN